MSEKKHDLPGDEDDDIHLIECGSTVYGKSREESAEPTGPPDPEMGRRTTEACFRVLPVSPIVN